VSLLLQAAVNRDILWLSLIAMIADMISMMSDPGIRVELVPLMPTVKCSGLSEVLRTCRLHRHNLKLNSLRFIADFCSPKLTQM
jgi:hypothetical protein